MKKFIVIALAILCFASCDESTPTDTKNITDTQSESDTGNNTDTQSDTDTGSATDTQRETEIVTGTGTVTDTENDEPEQNVTFDEKILFNINPWDDAPYNSNFIMGQNERHYTINEYGERNLIYMPETSIPTTSALNMIYPEYFIITLIFTIKTILLLKNTVLCTISIL